MATVFVNDEYLSDIADAIGEKKSVSTTYTPAEMGDAVRSISTALPIVITSQPSDYTGSLGDYATFSVAATGDSLTYQWQYKSLRDGKWYNANVTGATAATMSIEVTAARDGMQFRCVLTDAGGNISYSNPATLRVATAGPVLITKSVTANGTYSAGDDSADGYSSLG